MIRHNLTNYSELARKLCEEIFGSQKNFYAVKAALMRFSSKIRKRENELEGKVLEILKDTSITIMNKVVVLISTAPLVIDAISSVKSGNCYTYIATQQNAKKSKYPKNILHMKQNLNLFVLSSPFQIENTAGVISTILHLLASEGINVQEFISCYTDTLLVINEADSAKAYELLSELTDAKPINSTLKVSK